jgi:hypothetical protein
VPAVVAGASHAALVVGMERYVALVVNVPAVPASHCAFVVGVKTYVAVLVNVPGVVAASHSAFVVVPQTAGVAPAQVPALSKHSVWVPGHAAVSHVPSGMSGTAPAQVPTLSSHSASVLVHAEPSHVPATYVAVLVNVPGVVAAAHSAFVVVPGMTGSALAQVPTLSKHSVSVPAHATASHVPVTYAVVVVNVPAEVAGASHCALVVGVKTYVAVLVNVPGVGASHAALVVGVKTYVAVLVNVPGVSAAAHSAFVVVHGMPGTAPVQVPALSLHSTSVPGHAAVSHVPSGMSGTASAQVPALSLHSTSVPNPKTPSHVPYAT